MTRLSVAVVCCMAATLISPQDVNADPYTFKKERPGLGGGEFDAYFVTDKNILCSETDSANVVSTLTPARVGAIKGYRADDYCTAFGNTGKRYAKFTCSADPVDGAISSYTVFQNPGCGFTSKVSGVSIAKCKQDDSDAEGAKDYQCQHITDKHDSIGSLLITGTLYGGRNDCRKERMAEGALPMLLFLPENVGCHRLKKADGTDSHYFFKNECPAQAGPVTTLWLDQNCETKYDPALHTSGFEYLAKVYEHSIIELGKCHYRDGLDNYDTCTLITRE